MVDCRKRLVEVYEILTYLEEEDLKKIPQDIIDTIRENKDTNYIWKYDEEKSLKEQSLHRDTIIMLSYLNTKYLLDDEQRELIEQMHEYNEQKLQKEKIEKYNPDIIFKNIDKQVNGIEMSENKNNIVLIKYKDSLFNKFKKLIFRIINKNK